MHKFKRVIALLMALTMAVFCIPLSGLEALAASLTPGQTNQTVVTCFYAQTGENMPRRQYGASSLLTNTIRDVEGKGICMLFVEADGASIADLGVGSSLTADKIKKTNGGKNMWAYCIQHGNSAGDGGGYVVTAETVDEFFQNQISLGGQTGIKATLLVGYPTSNFGYSACDAYAATQAVIWEFQTGIRTIKYTNGKPDGTTLSSSRETQNFGSTTKAAYNALVAQVNAFLTAPVFTGTGYNSSTNTVTLKWNSSRNRYEGTITDSKSVINNYYLKTASTGISASISGNTLTLYTTNPALKNVNLTFEHSVVNSSNKSDQTLMVLEHATQQKIAVGTASDPLTMGLRGTVEDVGNLTITKNTQYGNGSNYGGDLSGWKFTVEGYAGSTKVSTNNVTTGSNGKATLSNLPLYSGTTLISYRITETGNTNTSIQNKYLWNATGTVSTTLTAPTSSGISTTNVNYANKLKMGKIALYKYYELEDGSTVIEPGAKFQVYLKSAGSYADANANFKDTITTDSNGYAITKDLPYGTYTVHQTVGNQANYFIKDFDINITEDGKTVMPIDLKLNEGIRAYLKVEKKDVETGKTIPLAGAEFEIYDKDHNLVTWTVYNGSGHETISKITSNADGIAITPEPLFYGNYYLKEIKAPEGYVLDDELKPFSITKDNHEGVIGTVTYQHIIDANPTNQVQKGVIKVFKEGLMFTSVTQEEDGTYTPVYETRGLEGARFAITAAEDIYTPEGTLQYAEGSLVDIMTTGATGWAYSDELYLGKYLVTETQAPENFVLDDTPHEAELVYAGQEFTLTETSLDINNVKQSVEFKLLKSMQNDETFGIGQNGEVANVVFGIYAKEELTALDGTKIPKDGLLEAVAADADGFVQVTKDLPIGTYYFKEISTDAHYILNTTEFEVRFEYRGQNVDKVIYYANQGNAVDNELKYGEIQYTKLNEDGEPLSGVVFGLYREDDTSFANPIMTTTTDENGNAVFVRVPYGTWVIKEISTLEPYVLDETPHTFVIEENEQREEQLVINNYKRGTVRVVKVDAEFPDEKLSGATFEVYDAIAHQDPAVYEEVEERTPVLENVIVYPIVNFMDFIVGRISQAWHTGDNTMETVTEQFGSLAVNELIDDNHFIDKMSLFELAVYDWSQWEGENIITSTDSGYRDAISNIISDYDVYRAIFQDGYDFLYVAVAKGDNNKTYKEKLIKLDSSNEEHRTLINGFGVSEGTVLSETMYKRYTHMAEVFTAMQERIDAGEVDPANMSTEELQAYMYDMMYGGISEGVMLIVYPSDDAMITDNYELSIYDPELKNMTGMKTKLVASVAKTGEPGNNFFVLGNDGGSAGMSVLSGTVYQFTEDTNPWDNFIVANSIEWTDEWTDEDNIFGGGAGKTYPMAYLTAEYEGKEVEFIAIDIKSTKGDDWPYDTAVYAFDKEVFEEGDFSDINIEVLSDFLGGANFVMMITDDDLAEKYAAQESVSVTLSQIQRVTKLVKEAGEITYTPGKKIGTLTEVSKGVYEFGDLRYGTYFLRETKAPEGFLLDDNYYQFDIRNDGEIVTVSNAELFKNGIPAKHIDGKKLVGLFANEPIYAPVVITKTDIVDGKVLPGAGFRIKDADDNVVAEGYTDENGEFETYLRYGKYSFEEFDAPEGYEINTEIGYFEITEEGKIVKAKMEDERIADTDGYDLVEENKVSISPVMIGVILSMIVLFGAYILNNNNSPKKRKENNN